MFDFAIVGGGPAGATLARLLALHYKIAIFEKRDLESGAPGAGNEKCCGGLLAPDAQKVLAALSLGLPRSVIVDPQLFAVRSLDLPSGKERYYQRHYLNIDRFKFDCWLWSLIPDRAVKFPACLVTGFSPGRRGFIVTYRCGGREYAVEAGAVLGADGARSLTRERLGVCRKDRRHLMANHQAYFCIEEWFACPSRPPFFSALFDPSITDFYAWIIPKNDKIILGSAIDPQKKPLEKFELLKRILNDRGLALGRPEKKHGGFLIRPRRPGDVILSGVPRGFSGRRLALVGEAAGLVSPSSGEGISFALESAMLLASAIRRRGDDFDRAYRKSALRMRSRLFLKNLKTPFLYNPWLRQAMLASGLQSVCIDRDAIPTSDGREQFIRLDGRHFTTGVHHAKHPTSP